MRIAIVIGAGAVSPSSLWRGEIIKKMGAGRPTRIHVPFSGDEILPLIHVADVAEIVSRLVKTSWTSYPVYNTPTENWKCSDLAHILKMYNKNVELDFSSPSVRSDPEAIDGRRFVDEFGFTLIPLQDRLRWNIENGGE